MADHPPHYVRRYRLRAALTQREMAHLLEQAQLFNAALIDAGIETQYLAVKGAGHALREPELLVQVGAFFDDHLGGRAAAVFRKHLAQQPKPTNAVMPVMKRDR